MCYLENSFIVGLIVRFWAFICRLYQNSFLSRLVNGLVSYFCSGCVWRFLTHDGLGKSWEESRLCRLLQWCADLPVRFFAWIGRIAPRSRIAAFCGWLVVPALGLMMFLLFIIPQERWNNLYSLAMSVGICLLFFVYSLSGEKHSLSVGSVGVWPVLFFIIVALSWLWSDVHGESARFLFFAVTCALVVLLFASSVDTEKKLMTVLRISTLGLAVCAVYALYQRYIGVEPDEVLTDLSIHSDMPGRVYSFFENPNSFANLLVFFAPLMLTMAIYARKSLERLAYLLVFLLCGLALLMTYSRGGWLALAFSIFILMLFVCPRWVPLVVILCFAAIPLLPQNILHRLLSIFNGSDSSTYTRGYIYSAMLKLIRNHPVFGVGLGADAVRRAVVYEQVYIAKANFSHGHNIFMQIWAESGIFALVAFLGSMFATMRNGRRALKKLSSPTPVKGIIVGSISGLAGALLFGITDYAWSYPRVMVLFWYLFALLLAGIHTINKEAGIANEQ